jgi:plastocyanin
MTAFSLLMFGLGGAHADDGRANGDNEDQGQPAGQVHAVGLDTIFVPNQFIKSTFHFKPGHVQVPHGGTLTFVDDTTDGHTLSLVKPGDVPKTAVDVNSCFDTGPCGPIVQAHFPNGQNGPPVPIVNKGAPGFDTPGDSLLVGPKGSGHETNSVIVSAPAGSTFRFICAFHPWMQGTLNVT